MLYNKYRPKRFEDVVGQVAAVVLKNAANGKRKFPHSLLLSGTRGTGKTTLARIFAKALNCSADSDKPCGKCKSCKLKHHPDIVEVDAAANGNPSALSNVVQLMGSVPEFTCKVFIFDEAHAITVKGMDMLLKTVEEPSARTVCLFLTTNPDKINAALRSRCCWLQLRNLSKKEIMKVIARVAIKEEIDITPKAVSVLADHANGSARDSLSMLESVCSMPGTITTSTVDFVVGHRVNTHDLVNYMKVRDASGAMGEVVRLCSYHEARLVAESAVTTCMEEAHTALSNKRPAAVFANWAKVFNDAKAEMMRGVYYQQTSLEVAVAEIMLREKAVPPASATSLFDWSSFVMYVATKSSKAAKRAARLSYVRFKGTSTVVCKRVNRDKTFSADRVETVQGFLRSFLKQQDITLEVV